MSVALARPEFDRSVSRVPRQMWQDLRRGNARRLETNSEPWQGDKTLLAVGRSVVGGDGRLDQFASADRRERRKGIHHVREQG
jgi:flagellar biosynthesis/type III secretory pathway ATPase